MIPIFATLILLAHPSTLQGVGGGSETLYQWAGGTTGDWFGVSVSDAGDVNGDGFSDVIVGANNAEPGGLINSGAAMVYSGADGSLLYSWSGEAIADEFGTSVSSAGDVNGDGVVDLIVGAPVATNPGLFEAGAAYVYSGATGMLLYQWNGQAAFDMYGYSVSGAGDVNGDGFDDVIVGAKQAAPGGRGNAGSTYVYSGADGSLLHQWDGTTAGLELGESVSGAGDINSDGFDDLIVGAALASPGGIFQSQAGSAFVFSGVDGTVLFRFDGEARFNLFGASVSSAGDVDRDGIPDLIVGAFRANANGLNNSGSAYVYSGADGSLLHKWNGESAEDKFGSSVAGIPDINGDGWNDLLVGAPYTAPGGLWGAGSVYALSGRNGTLLHRWDGESASSFFGASTSGAGDVNGDGFPDIISGAFGTDYGGHAAAGTAHAFSFQPYLMANTATISASAGGMINLSLNFPGLAGSDEFKILISASGTGPSNYGVEIPLTLDGLVIDTFYGNYPVPATNMHGILDSSGNATASLVIPAGIPSALVGRTYFVAAIANQAGQLPEYSSVAVSIGIAP